MIGLKRFNFTIFHDYIFNECHFIVTGSSTSFTVVRENDEPSVFCVSNELNSLTINDLKSICGVNVVALDLERRCLVQVISSSHRLPRSVIVKEMRMATDDNNNEITYFCMNEEVGNPQIVTSSNDLINSATEFFSSPTCYGLPFNSSQFEKIKSMRTGFKNILNRWQSSCSTGKIELSQWNWCLQCDKLRKALMIKDIRYGQNFLYVQGMINRIKGFLKDRCHLN